LVDKKVLTKIPSRDLLKSCLPFLSQKSSSAENKHKVLYVVIVTKDVLYKTRKA